MQRLFLQGKRFLKFSAPKFHHASYFRFSAKTNTNPNVETIVVAPRKLYTEENYQKIEKLQQLSYQSLLDEIKKHPNRPKGRTKTAILQFLIEQIPIKETSNGSIEYEQINLADNENRSYDYLEESDYVGEKEVKEYNKTRKIFNESPVFRNLKDFIGISQYEMERPLDNKGLPYIETYPEKQILEELRNIKSLGLRREVEHFVQRSPLFEKSSFLQKIKKQTREELKDTLHDLIFLHREYADLSRNILKPILDSKTKYRTLECLEILRSLDNPVNFTRMYPYLQTLSANSLLEFWQVIFESIDKYDLNTLDMVFRMALQLKESCNLNFSDPASLSDLDDKISSRAVDIVNSSNLTYSIVSLAGIINNSRKMNMKLTPLKQQNMQALGHVLLKKYSEEKFGVAYENLGMTPKEMLTLAFAVLYVAEDEATRADVYQKLRAADIKNFEKQYLKEFLLFLSNKKLVPDKGLIQDIKENYKLTENLDLFDIYLILHTSKEAQTDFSKIYLTLFYQFFSIAETRNALRDMKSILLCAKIMSHILEYHITDHRKPVLEKRANQLLMLLESSIEVLEEPIQVIDLIEISSLFIPYLNSPDFLFTKILLHLDDLIVTNENKNKIAKFVNKFLDKIEPKYTFNTFLTHTDLEFNDKFTEFTAAIFRKLIMKFRESNLLTYIVLNIRIASNPTFLRFLLPDAQERNSFLDYLGKQILGLTSSAASVGAGNLKIIMKFMFTAASDINPNFMILMHQKLLPQFFTHVAKTSTSFNELLDWMYFICCSLSESKNEGLNPTNEKNKEALIKKLKEFTVERIVNPFCENASLTVQQIIYDKDVSQYFNPNVFNTNFENLEYLLPILEALDIQILPIIERNIISQFPRCIKRWNGEILVKNLLLLDQFKIHCPELFEFAIPNLFSCFTFYFDMQNLVLNKDMISEKQVLKLLRAYVNQKEVKYFKEINKSIGQEHFTKQNATMIPLGAMLYKTMHLLTPEEIIDVIMILGDERKNYMQAFIDKFYHLQFKNLTPKKVFDLKTCLPSFLQNESINSVFYSSIESRPKDISLSKIFMAMMKERLWISDITLNVIKEIEMTKSLELLQDFLSYIATTGRNLTDLTPILSLTQSFGPTVPLSEDAMINLLVIFYIFELEKTNMKDSSLEELPQNYLDMIKAISMRLLRSEAFYFFENVVKLDGKIHRLKYFGSFALNKDFMSNTFKVLPKNKTGSIENLSSNSSENDLFVSQTGPSEENLFEASKAFGEDTVREEYKSTALKYFLYRKFHKLAGVPEINEQLASEFVDRQNKNFNLLKFKENFANFLIDVTLILHELGLLYKTNLECEYSKILIDITLIDTKTAIIFVDQQETICELKNGEKHYYPNNFHKMKADLLRQAGWNVIPLVFETWNAKFDTKEKKEYDLKKKIDEFRNINISCSKKDCENLKY